MEIVTHAADTDEPRGSVLVTHGLGEHQGRYAPLISALTESGYDVYSYDQRGHGTASGPRARVDVGSLIIDHLDARREVLGQARTPDLFLVGHSLGGLVTAASSLLDGTHLRGLLLTGPALRPRNPVSPRVARAVLPLARLLPWLPASFIPPTALSRDPDAVAAAKADPLVHHGPIPLLTGATLIVQGDQVIRNAAMLTIPVLILHGGADALSDVSGSRDFIDHVRTSDAHLRIIDGAFHEVLNEPEGPALIDDIIAWMDRH